MPEIIRCRSCGGKLEFAPGQKVCTCKYCQSVNTLTIPDNIQLYNSANDLRNRCEFDRAIHLYEDMIKMDPTDAESYFGLALCKYGIEYVLDPMTGRRIPTCRRLQMTPMAQDEDFKKAIQYADDEVARVYQSECIRIDKILSRIRILASNGEKFDVFISYKETDDFGSRTEASVIAQDLYERLTRQGYRVFFSRKTLESMAGVEYEPVIYSALHSAKVMLLLGTKPEQFEAVWVKNEWSRYIARMNTDPTCRLIPLYKDMRPEELPQQVRNFQAISMDHIGFEQDVTDAVGKLVRKKQKGAGQGITVENIRERAYLEMENKSFGNASKLFEQALLHDPEDWESYLGKLLCTYKKQSMEEILAIKPPVEYRTDGDYKMFKRFAPPEKKEQIEKWERQTAIARKNQSEVLYTQGKMVLEMAAYNEAIQKFNGALAYQPDLAKAYLGRYLARHQLKSIDGLRALETVPEKDQDMVNAMNYATQEERDELEEIFREIEERVAQQEKKEVEQAWKDVTRTPFIFTIIYVALVTHPGIVGFVMGLLYDIVGSGNIILFVGVGLVYLLALLLYFFFYFLGPLAYILGPSIPDAEEKDGEGDKDKPKEPPKKHLPGERKRRVFNLVTGIPLTILCYYLLFLNVSEVIAGAF